MRGKQSGNTPPSNPAYAVDSDRLRAKKIGPPLFSPKLRPTALHWSLSTD